MEYGNVVWGGSYDTDINKLEKINIAAMRLISGATSNSNISNLYGETALLTIHQRIDNATLIMLYKIMNNNCPNYLSNLMPPFVYESSQYRLRSDINIKIPAVRLEIFKRSFFHRAIRLWNAL